jgi:hypothetical protein
LAAQEDAREAIEAVKRLQILWKETGQASRGQDQALWGEFREVCDTVYRRRDQAHADYTAGLEAAKVEAERLCDEVERQAAAVGTELISVAAKIPDWRAAYEALDEMPRAEARGLNDRFERAIRRLESEIALARVRDAERAFGQLFEALRHIRAYEWAVSHAAGDRQILKQTAEDYVAGVARWPKGTHALVKEAMRRAEAALPAEPGEAEKALRLLCVRAEIRGDVATPDEDVPLRRAYQVQRLMTGMGQGARLPHEVAPEGAVGDDPAAGEWDALLLAWIPLGGVAPAVHAALQARFLESLGPRPVARPQRTSFQTRHDAGERRDPPSRGRSRSGIGR